VEIKSDEDGLQYEAEVAVWPEATVGDYKKLKVKKPTEDPVTEKEIDKIVEYLQKQKGEMKEVDRPAKENDWVAIDFEGKMGGVVQENMTSKNHPVILGSGTLIPGFEKNIEGMKAGAEKTFGIVFPKDYNEKSVAGKKAEFKVKLLELKEVILPQVTDDFVKDFGHKDVAGMREGIKESLKKEKEEKRKLDTENLVLDKLLGVTKADIPEALVEQELDRIFARMERQAKSYGMTLEQYLLSMKKTQAELRGEWRGQAEKHVKVGLALGEVAKREKFAAKDEKVTEKVVNKLVTIMTS
jgi:trigger factor